ncbi:hypothetical protein EEB12_29345 [Rhodococcus sp. WS1]|nr:hypothetical protein EEB12_29345 [Rhodococcus sp. WS1]
MLSLHACRLWRWARRVPRARSVDEPVRTTRAAVGQIVKAAGVGGITDNETLHLCVRASTSKVLGEEGAADNSLPAAKKWMARMRRVRHGLGENRQVSAVREHQQIRHQDVNQLRWRARTACRRCTRSSFRPSQTALAIAEDVEVCSGQQAVGIYPGGQHDHEDRGAGGAILVISAFTAANWGLTAAPAFRRPEPCQPASICSIVDDATDPLRSRKPDGEI